MVANSWEGISELVFGKVLQKDLDWHAVPANDLSPPYSDGMRHIKRAKEVNKNRLADVIGLTALQTAYDAGKSITLPMDWTELLRRAAARNEAGQVMIATGEKLFQGDAVDVSPVIRAIGDLQEERRMMVPLSEVEPEKEFWIKTGFESLDYHLGGLPGHGVTVCGAPPGTGKTSLLVDLATCFVEVDKTKKRKVGLFSLEQTAGELLARQMQLRMNKVPMHVRKRMLVCDKIIPIEDIVAIASQYAVDGLDFIGIDFADLIIRGEESEQKMAAVYKGLVALSKNLRMPVLLLSQLSRKYAVGTIPKLDHLRYSGMAEALTKLVLFIHNPRNIHTAIINEAEERKLPSVKGRAYIVIAKSRYGFGMHDEPGAIQLPWERKTGWKNVKGTWMEIN